MNFGCVDSKSVTLDLISLQSMNCEKFKAGSCPKSCQYYNDCYIWGMMPSSIAILQRYAREIALLKGENLPEEVVLEETVHQWLASSWVATLPLEKISEMAQNCEKHFVDLQCNEACPYRGKDWCIGASCARYPITLFARYAAEIEKLREKGKNNHGKN